jgi:protein TonB
MPPLFHALNIVTLATWLSAAGFGMVGLAVHGTPHESSEKPRDAYDKLATIELTEDFFPGVPADTPSTEAGDTGESDDAAVPLQEEETLHEPPEMPELAELAPLPEVPDLPEPVKKSEPAVTSTPVPRRAPTTRSKPPTRTQTPVSKSGGSPQGSAGATGRAGNGGRNGGSGVSDATRLAGGRMPAPSYPSEARSKGQSGTVVVEFIVGENGRVISAYAKKPSPWPLLNDRAVSAVLRWKFPPGGVAKFTRPIVFKLN